VEIVTCILWQKKKKEKEENRHLLCIWFFISFASFLPVQSFFELVAQQLVSLFFA